jgi:hypothetical protein
MYLVVAKSKLLGELGPYATDKFISPQRLVRLENADAESYLITVV